MAMSEMSQEILKRADAIGVWASGSLDKIGVGVGKVSQIAYDQAIEIAQQYIIFGTVYLTCTVIFGVLLTGLACWLLSKVSFSDDYHLLQPEITVLHLVGGVLTGALGLITFFTNFKDMVMVWAAPKMWIILQLAELAKSTKAATGS